MPLGAVSGVPAVGHEASQRIAVFGFANAFLTWQSCSAGVHLTDRLQICPNLALDLQALTAITNS